MRQAAPHTDLARDGAQTAWPWSPTLNHHTRLAPASHYSYCTKINWKEAGQEILPLLHNQVRPRDRSDLLQMTESSVAESRPAKSPASNPAGVLIMSFQALRKFRIPPPHPQLLSTSASSTRVWAEEQRSASPDFTQISTPLHPTLQCLSCVNRRLGHKLNDLWKGNRDSPYLFISVCLSPKILPHFVPESLCLCFPCSRGSEPSFCSLGATERHLLTLPSFIGIPLVQSVKKISEPALMYKQVLAFLPCPSCPAQNVPQWG